MGIASIIVVMVYRYVCIYEDKIPLGCNLCISMKLRSAMCIQFNYLQLVNCQRAQ